MADLWAEFPDLAPSAIKRVLDSLESKGLVAHAGDESQVYVQGVHWWSTAAEPVEDPALAAIAAALEQSKLDVEHSVDAHAGTVQVFVPLVEFEGELQGLPSATLDGVRSCISDLEAQDHSVRLTINTEITSDPEPMVTVHLHSLVDAR